MASGSASNQPIKGNNKNDDENVHKSLSYFKKTVCLEDWWLIKLDKDLEGKRLGIGGFTSREQKALRVFSSASILKRHETSTLETIDGIWVIIKGFINKARTVENGFPSEVFDHFVFGFPPYWEEYAERCLGGGFTSEVVAGINPSLDKLQMQTTPEIAQMIDSREGISDDKSDFGEKVIISKDANTSRKKTKRKLTYETPVSQKGMKEASIVSPESLGFKRSRSGRLLLPTLEFWRNQVAIYDTDRRVTGIKEGLHAVQPLRGGRSEPQKKRRKRT